ARSAMHPGTPPGAQLIRPPHNIAHAPSPLADLAVAFLTTSSPSSPALLARVWVHHVHRNKPQRYLI
ncbi:hypothetical protein SCHPADRAFT_906456, partial [Schizopora paradoxa]